METCELRCFGMVTLGILDNVVCHSYKTEIGV
jgi:hypothetical protein